MKFVKGKLGWLSALLLAGMYAGTPPAGIAQERGHESHFSMQAAPNRAQSNNFGRVQGNQNWQHNNAGRWNYGQRWNNSGRWSNNFGSNRFNDRNRNRNWGQHDRDRGHFNVYGGAPFYPYSYGPGYYYGNPYGYDYYDGGYYDGNSYDMGYSDGFNAGRYDRIQGNLYNPRQYERSGDPDYFAGFVAGYENGYNS